MSTDLPLEHCKWYFIDKKEMLLKCMKTIFLVIFLNPNQNQPYTLFLIFTAKCDCNHMTSCKIKNILLVTFFYPTR